MCPDSKTLRPDFIGAHHWRNSSITSRTKALFIAQAALSKKAQDIVILDMRKLSSVTDFFVICSGNSTRQVRAVADHLAETLKKHGHKIWHREGYQHALWILLDCNDVVAHIFHNPLRRFYDLERLWRDAARINLPR